MSVTDRLVVLAIFGDLLFIPFSIGQFYAADFSGWQPWLLYLMFYGPLLALPLLIVGLNLSRPAWHKAVSSLALGLMAACLLTFAFSFDYARHGLVRPYADLRPEDVQSACMYVDGAQLDEGDKRQLIELLQQVTYYNPSTWVEDYVGQVTPESDTPFQFYLRRENARNILIAAWPPYYVDNAVVSYQAADEEVCRQLADLYWQLKAKYYPPEPSLAAAE